MQEIFSVVLASPQGTEVNGDSLKTDDEIAGKARIAAGRDKDVRAVIKADGAVPHRRVMHVLDVLREAGVAKIGFGVMPVAPDHSQPRATTAVP